MSLTKNQISQFQKKILTYYKKHGRDLPWRKTKDPYHIIVSEIMLQQTQVDRVLPKYIIWLKKFPTLTILAQSTLAEVLIAWQGLGYNRRARFLHELAKIICTTYEGEIPTTPEALKTLPGIGPATAASISAFAFNRPTIFLETNIRSVFIHEFFNDHDRVDDAVLLKIAAQVLDHRNPRRWYNALMDYGSMLKKKYNPSRQSKHYTKQSTFKGSDRQIRGQILKALIIKPLTKKQLCALLSVENTRVTTILNNLCAEQLIQIKNKTFSLGA